MPQNVGSKENLIKKKYQVDTLNSAKLIFYVKINFVRHQHDTERTKTERDRSRRQLFRFLGDSSVGRNKKRGSGVKFPHTLF